MSPGRALSAASTQTRRPTFRPAARRSPTASLADGSHTFEVRATDPAGNTDPTPASRTFTVDTVPPDTTITGGPRGAHQRPNPDLHLLLRRGRLDLRVPPRLRRRSRLQRSGDRPHPSASLSDGTHTFEVRATDPAGNTDPTPASRGLHRRHRRRPDTTINRRPERLAPTTPPRPSPSPPRRPARASSAASTPTPSPPAARRDDPHAAPRSDGTHTFEVRATDPAGNTDPTPASARLHGRHRARPDTTITRRPERAAPTTRPRPSPSPPRRPGLDLRVPHRLRRLRRLQLREHPHARRPRSRTASHTFEVRATDPAGNTDPTPGLARLHASTPRRRNTTIDRRPSGRHQRPDPDLHLLLRGGRLDLRVPLRLRRLRACAALRQRPTPTSTSLSDSSHTFEVRATDPAGNTDPTPGLARASRVDTVPPNTTITGGPSGATNDPTPTFTFSSSEAGLDLPVQARLRRLCAPAARRRPPRTSRTAPTPSTSAPPTRPATSTPPRPPHLHGPNRRGQRLGHDPRGHGGAGGQGQPGDHPALRLDPAGHRPPRAAPTRAPASTRARAAPEAATTPPTAPPPGSP